MLISNGETYLTKEMAEKYIKGDSVSYLEKKIKDLENRIKDLENKFVCF